MSRREKLLKAVSQIQRNKKLVIPEVSELDRNFYETLYRNLEDALLSAIVDHSTDPSLYDPNQSTIPETDNV